METITYRFSHAGAGGQQGFELRGQRLLAGHADTGVFKIVVLAAPKPDKVLTVRQRRCRDDGDGLAPASVEILGPLALTDSAPGGDPRNRCGRNSVSQRDPWRGR